MEILVLTVERRLTGVLNAANHSDKFLMWRLACRHMVTRIFTNVLGTKNHSVKLQIWENITKIKISDPGLLDTGTIPHFVVSFSHPLSCFGDPLCCLCGPLCWNVCPFCWFGDLFCCFLSTKKQQNGHVHCAFPECHVASRMLILYLSRINISGCSKAHY